MKAIVEDQVMSIINDMKEAVRSDRNIDSRDSIEILHDIRSLGKAVKKGEMEDVVVEKVMRACCREESLKSFPQQLMPFIPELSELVPSQG